MRLIWWLCMCRIQHGFETSVVLTIFLDWFLYGSHAANPMHTSMKLMSHLCCFRICEFLVYWSWLAGYKFRCSMTVFLSHFWPLIFPTLLSCLLPSALLLQLGWQLELGKIVLCCFGHFLTKYFRCPRGRPAATRTKVKKSNKFIDDEAEEACVALHCGRWPSLIESFVFIGMTSQVMMMLEVSKAQKCEFADTNVLYLSDYLLPEPRVKKKEKMSLCLCLQLLLARGESFYYYSLQLFTILFNRRSAASTPILLVFVIYSFINFHNTTSVIEARGMHLLWHLQEAMMRRQSE